MRKFLFLFLIPALSLAQRPAKPDAADIYKKLEKLNFLGSVLYVAAHPDDENTRLISYYANHVNARTGYLSLTRGDGGQNLIGHELREGLGVIRTQELLEARKIDGGEQFFSRANDFGYSKNPDETLNIWNRREVLSDVVWAIRKFRPDVIVNRFDHRSPGTTHGHHTASAQLSVEAFDLAARADQFPEQLSSVSTWQPRRIFFNTSYWFYGGKEKFEKADKSHLWKVPVNDFDPLTGLSNAEIAALSRSRHQSQGFGSTGTRGDETDYIEFLKGDPATPGDVFQGIDTSWKRVKGGAEIGAMVDRVIASYDFKQPHQIIPQLVKIWQKIQSIEDDHWKTIKSAEVADIIAAASGLYLEVVADAPDAVPGSTVNLKFEAINRSPIEINLESVEILPYGQKQVIAEKLGPNQPLQKAFPMMIGRNAAFTQPYWLASPYSIGMYTVEQALRGRPDVIREHSVTIYVSIDGVRIPFSRTIIHKYNDSVTGEKYEPFDVVPPVTSRFSQPTYLFSSRKKSDKIAVIVKSGKAGVAGSVKLVVPEGWMVSPASASFEIPVKGGEHTAYFDVTASKTYGEYTLKSVVTMDGAEYAHSRTDIAYPHIPKQMILEPAQAKGLYLDLKIGNEKIAYIMGAGDQVNTCLRQMGYDVTDVDPATLSKETLARFDVVITGIRAYNIVQSLAVKQKLLLDFVQSGKTLIVQYNTLDGLVTPDFSPYALSISRDRVTQEDAEVRFLAPQHRALTHPNRITPEDFKGWVQEQGLYYPNRWDSAFTPLISSNDAGESPKNGALLVARYGKGHYIYTGLSFFRELPAGVGGAYRLIANLISLK
jgi:LmbE family N-acetylglucosaminyl deacetylase